MKVVLEKGKEKKRGHIEFCTRKKWAWLLLMRGRVQISPFRN